MPEVVVSEQPALLPSAHAHILAVGGQISGDHEASVLVVVAAVHSEVVAHTVGAPQEVVDVVLGGRWRNWLEVERKTLFILK